MTKIDFYLLDNDEAQERERTACRLADKAFRQGHRVYMHTDYEADARHLDQLLWTFSPGSFIPHGLHSSNIDPDIPVCLGHGTSASPPAGFDDVLISLADSVPEFFSRFERVAEIVGTGETDKQQARERYRFYRDHGYELQSHNL